MMNFFREGNLNALREMALRLAAEHVGQEVHDYLQAMQITGPWKSGHRLLVAVSPSPYAAHMIRWTRRLADNYDCPWLAVYVEQPQSLTEADQARLTKHLALARELGAEVVATADRDIASGLLRVAEQQNVTQIILGKPGGNNLLDRWRGGRFLRRLVRDSGHIDLHVVRPEAAEPAKTSGAVSPARPGISPPRQYLAALATVAGCTVLNWILQQVLSSGSHPVDSHALAMFYLLGVVVLACFVGRGPTLLTATASALLWDFFFTEPRFSLKMSQFADVMMFAMYFVVAIVMGQLVSRIRWQERAESRREERSTALVPPHPRTRRRRRRG